MKLSACKMGEIVRDKGNKKRIGHIVGLAFNNTMPEHWNNVIPVVKFVGEQLPVSIHHENIELL